MAAAETRVVEGAILACGRRVPFTRDLSVDGFAVVEVPDDAIAAHATEHDFRIAELSPGATGAIRVHRADGATGGIDRVVALLRAGG